MAASRGAPRLLLRGPLQLLGLRTHTLLLLPELGRELCSKVLRFEHLANFDLGFSLHGVWAALDPIDRLCHRLHLPQPETGNQLLRLGEGPVNDSPLASRKLDARSF